MRSQGRVECNCRPFTASRVPSFRYICKPVTSGTFTPVVTIPINAAVQAQLQAPQRWAQALKDNPLLAYARELRKQAPSKGGRGKCIICGSPHRAIIEDIYRRERCLKGVLSRMRQVGMKGSHPAVWNHFKRHYVAAS